jgi:hypothetical protein
MRYGWRRRVATLQGAGKHCKQAEIADDAPDDRQLGLAGVAAHIATRCLIAAINRIRNGRQDVAIAHQALV